MLVRVESLKIEMENLERRANKRIERFRAARKRSHSEELLEIERKFQILRAKPSNGVDVLKTFEMLMLNLSTLNERFSYEEFNNTSNSKINRTTLNSYQQYCLSNRIRTFSKVYIIWIYIYKYKILINIDFFKEKLASVSIDFRIFIRIQFTWDITWKWAQTRSDLFREAVEKLLWNSGIIRRF